MTKKLTLDYGTENDLTITRIHFNASMSVAESSHEDDKRTSLTFDCDITNVELIVSYRVDKEAIKREISTYLSQEFINNDFVNEELLDYVNDNVADLWAKQD